MPPVRPPVSSSRFVSFAAVLLLLGGCSGSDAATGTTGADPSASSSVPSPTEVDEATEDPGVDPVLVDRPDEPAATLTLDEAGFDLDSVTVPVGGVVTFTSTDGGPHGVFVGSLDGVTVLGGLEEYYRFDAPGTYPVRDEITEATATVVVE